MRAKIAKRTNIMADQKVRRRAKPKTVPVIPAIKPTYEVPKWAGKPPTGMHLDVTKDGKLIEKFIVDGKNHFFFGRQKEFIDFTIDHSSCSRVHSVMLYHKHLQRMFLLDLGSTHGTFMGSIRLEANKPMQLPIDESFHFGASTRTWVLREKPNMPQNMESSLNSSATESNDNDAVSVSLLGLPEAENELNDLTEFNTAHNRRLATLPIDEANIVNPLSRKRRIGSVNVSFSSEEVIINPEDVDPTIGRFRNLVSTEIIIPNKKSRTTSTSSSDGGFGGVDTTSSHIAKIQQDFHSNQLYSELEVTSPTTKTLAPRITSAPDVEAPNLNTSTDNRNFTKPDEPLEVYERPSFEPVKKKYLKEAWPGRKPKGQNLLSV